MQVAAGLPFYMCTSVQCSSKHNLFCVFCNVPWSFGHTCAAPIDIKTVSMHEVNHGLQNYLVLWLLSCSTLRTLPGIVKNKRTLRCSWMCKSCRYVSNVKSPAPFSLL